MCLLLIRRLHNSARVFSFARVHSHRDEYAWYCWSTNWIRCCITTHSLQMYALPAMLLHTRYWDSLSYYWQQSVEIHNCVEENTTSAYSTLTRMQTLMNYLNLSMATQIFGKDAYAITSNLFFSFSSRTNLWFLFFYRETGASQANGKVTKGFVSIL